MKNWSVRQRIIVGFSVVFTIMLAFEHVRILAASRYRSASNALSQDSIPGLQLVGELRAVSTETFTSTQQHVLESDPAAMSKIMEFIQQKTVERLAILKQLDSYTQLGNKKRSMPRKRHWHHIWMCEDKY